MAEKNVFNKELGRYQTREEWDAFKSDQRAGLGDQADKFNQFGSSDINWKVTDDGRNVDIEGGTDIANEVKDLGNNAFSQIANFETGLRGWDTLDGGVQDWYLQRGFNPDEYTQQASYNTADEWNAYQQSQDLQSTADKFNQYGSDLAWRAGDGRLHFGDEGNTIYSDVQGIGDNAYSQILNFENGLRGWETLDQGVKDWYLDQYDPSQIVAGQDEFGNSWTVQDIMPITNEQVQAINTQQQENVEQMVGVNPNLNAATGTYKPTVTTAPTNPFLNQPPVSLAPGTFPYTDATQAGQQAATEPTALPGGTPQQNWQWQNPAGQSAQPTSGFDTGNPIFNQIGGQLINQGLQGLFGGNVQANPFGGYNPFAQGGGWAPGGLYNKGGKVR